MLCSQISATQLMREAAARRHTRRSLDAGRIAQLASMLNDARIGGMDGAGPGDTDADLHGSWHMAPNHHAQGWLAADGAGSEGGRSGRSGRSGAVAGGASGEQPISGGPAGSAEHFSSGQQYDDDDDSASSMPWDLADDTGSDASSVASQSGPFVLPAGQKAAAAAARARYTVEDVMLDAPPAAAPAAPRSAPWYPPAARDLLMCAVELPVALLAVLQLAGVAAGARSGAAVLAVAVAMLALAAPLALHLYLLLAASAQAHARRRMLWGWRVPAAATALRVAYVALGRKPPLTSRQGLAMLAAAWEGIGLPPAYMLGMCPLLAVTWGTLEQVTSPQGWPPSWEVLRRTAVAYSVRPLLALLGARCLNTVAAHAAAAAVRRTSPPEALRHALPALRGMAVVHAVHAVNLLLPDDDKPGDLLASGDGTDAFSGGVWRLAALAAGSAAQTGLIALSAIAFVALYGGVIALQSWVRVPAFLLCNGYYI